MKEPRRGPHVPTRGRLRTAILVALWIAAALLPGALQGQSGREIPADLLPEVMPRADRFGEKEGDPPAVRGYRVDEASGEETLVGFAFLTSDLPPEEKGYNGPIEVLVGIDTAGVVTGIRVTRYRESLRETKGDFLRRGDFQEQFRGKEVGDPFRIGRDVDGISGATITVDAMSRGVRRAARRVATAHIWNRGDDGTGGPARPPGTLTAEELEPLSLPEMMARGFLQRLVVVDEGQTAVELTVGFVADAAVGELLFGADAFARALEEAGDELADRHFLLLGVDGALSALYRPSAVWVVQETDSLRLTDDIVMLGEPRSGKVRGEFREVGVAFVGRALDPTAPFTVALDLRPGMPLAETEYPAPLPRPPATAEAPADPDPDAPAEAAAEGEPADPDPRAEEVELARGDPVPATSAAPAKPEEEPSSAPGPEPSGEDASKSDAPERRRNDAERGGAAERARGTTADGSAAASTDVPLPGPDAGARLADAHEEESALARTLGYTSWGRVAGTVLVLGLASVAFAMKRRPWLRGAALAATLVFLGFVDGGFLSVSHITSAVHVGAGVFLADLPLLLLVAFTLVTTVLWGRVFCGYLCPFGALQDVLDRVVPDRLQRRLPRAVHERGLLVKYGVLALILFPAIAGVSANVFQYVEPFGTVFYLSRSPLLWVIAGGLLLASAVVPRFYCRYACPLGAALALVSTVSPFRIRRVEQCTVCKVCEQSCPTGAIRGPEVDFRECVRCNVCERKLLERAGTCAHEMETVRTRLVQIEVPGEDTAGA